MGKRRGWQTVAIRRELIYRIRKILDMKIGYRSINEFVNEAVRLRLEELEKGVVVSE